MHDNINLYFKSQLPSSYYKFLLKYLIIQLYGYFNLCSVKKFKLPILILNHTGNY